MRKLTTKIILVLLISTCFTNIVIGQGWDALSNPKIKVKINHPPGLGLKINKIAFNTANGKCADQIINEMISDFVRNNVEVIDRANLQAVLAEHNLNLSGYIDKNSAVSIGNILGPSALLTVKVLRCNSEVKDNLYRDEKKYNAEKDYYYTVRAYIAKTKFYLKVSVQTTDLKTGRIFTARILEYSPYLEYKSYEGRPEVPSIFKVQELAFRYLISDVHKMFFEWVETTELYFFNDKKGGLKEAYKALKSRNTDQAFELSKTNLESCKNTAETKTKILAHAYYNMGMMYFIYSDYDNALINFQESNKLRSGSIVIEAINVCRDAKRLDEQMRKIDDNIAIQIEKNKSQTKQIEESKKSNTLTNEDIVILTEKKLPPKLIIQKIKTTSCDFDTSTEALIELTNAGIAEEVIIAMMEK
jgi:tetratricopeptide (TPR) repeat protein